MAFPLANYDPSVGMDNILARLLLHLQVDYAATAAQRDAVRDEATALLQSLASRYPALATAALTADDKAALDDVLLYSLLACLWRPLATGQASGNVASVRSADGSQVTFTTAPGDPRAEWLAAAAAALDRVTPVREALAAQIAAAGRVTVFGMVGRRGAIEQAQPGRRAARVLEEWLIERASSPLGGAGYPAYRSGA